MTTYEHHLAELFLKWETFQSCGQNQNTHYMFNDFSAKIVPLMRRGKYDTAGKATDDTKAHAFYMLDN
jgi:hypothetical protein